MAEMYRRHKTDNFLDLLLTTDGGFLVCGTTASTDGDVIPQVYTIAFGNYDAWLLKLDGNGNLQWQQRYGGTGNEVFNSIKATSDSGYIMAGWTTTKNDGDVWGQHDIMPANSPEQYIKDIWVVKTDNVGNLVWQRCLGSQYGDFATTVVEHAPDNYLIAGNAVSETTYAQSTIYSLVGTGANQIIGVQYFDSWMAEPYAINDLIPTADGKYVLATSQDALSATCGNVIKLTPTLNWLLATQNQQALNGISITPNPASDFISVNGDFNNESITIYNLLGQKISEQTIATNDKIDVSQLAVGVYSLQFNSSKATLKFVKQ